MASLSAHSLSRLRYATRFTRLFNLPALRVAGASVNHIFHMTARGMVTIPDIDSNRRVDLMREAMQREDHDDQGANTAIRPKLRVSDVLDTMEPKNFTIDQNATVLDALSHLVNEKIASSLVLNSNNEILGIFTARDILKFIQQHYTSVEHRQRRASFLTDARIKELMTPRSQLVYCSPSDSARRCREIMFQCRIRSLPIIDHGEVRGIITAKHLADASFSLKDTGGKKGFISNVTGRKGLPTGTKINPEALKANARQLSQAGALTLDMEMASFALPHPFKRPEGVAGDRRLYGADELSTDMSLCEDAHFALRITDPLASEPQDPAEAASEAAAGWGADQPTSAVPVPASGSARSHSYIYMCVADGVGSWRQYGVDPRAYSYRLVENARKVIESDMAHRELIRHSPFDRDLDPVHPLDVIMDAWNMTNSEGVVGSSTICVATLDRKLGQLSYSNVGDCGLVVVRHYDREMLGSLHQAQKLQQQHQQHHQQQQAGPGSGSGSPALTMPVTGASATGAAGRETVTGPGGVEHSLKIAFLSQQQLKSFNLPYQLGFSNLPEAPDTFESPADADTASISVLPGDIIILATDGLFDNMDLDEIVAEVAAWERSAPQGQGQGQQGAQGQGAPVEALAQQLVEKARLLSLDKDRDSPFALLAKENDIMWGGGMPDDTTVVVARVIRSG